MSDIVIKAENLGKKYLIGHQTNRGGYTALRDILMQNARTLWNKTKDLATGKPVIQGDTMEEVWALRDVSFEIRRGEAVGIIGRNGAGKSTLLKILSRITEPSAGRVTIEGRVASLLEVGTGFHSELSGRENIYLNGTILGMTRSEIKRKFDEIVAFAEVEKYLDTPVKRYSSGMYVRLAFAVAAHLEPEILVVDEVLAVGDAEFQEKCIGKMGAVAEEGRTVLFVSHNMSAIINLCNRALMIDCGTIKYAGNVHDTIAEYRGTIQKGTFIDLSSFSAGRRGPQEFAKFVSISVHDKNDNQSDIFAMGETIYIRLQIYFIRPVKHPVIGVMLRNSMGVLIHDCRSGFEGFFVEPGTGLCTFEIIVPEIKVYPGSYTLGPWIQKQVGIASDDYIAAALKITVVDNKLIGHNDSKFDVISKEGTETYQLSNWKII